MMIASRRWLSSSFLMCTTAVAIVVFGWSLGAAMCVPELAVADVNIGTYTPGQIVDCAVKVENKGWRSLLIYDAKPCCGTSLPHGFPRKINPRSVDVMIVRVLTHVNDHLPLTREFPLQTNDPLQPTANIVIRGMPEATAIVNPSSIHLGHVIAGMAVPKVATIELIVQGQSPRTVVSSSPNIRARLSQRDKGNRVAIDVELAEDMPRGPLQEYLYVRTGVPSQPNIIIPVAGNVERGLRPRPPQAFFGVVTGTEPVSRRVRLEVIGPGWDSPQVQPISWDGVRAEVVKEHETGLELVIVVDPERVPKMLKEQITLRNGNDDSIQIPIIAARKDVTEQGLRSLIETPGSKFSVPPPR